MLGDPWPPWVTASQSQMSVVSCQWAMARLLTGMVLAIWLPPDHCGLVPVSRDLGYSRRIARYPGYPGWLLYWWTKLCHRAYILCTCTMTASHPVRMFLYCMTIVHKDHTNTTNIYSVIVMTHIIALDSWQSSQGQFEPITPPQVDGWALVYPKVPISIGDWGWGVFNLSLLLWIMAATSSLIIGGQTCLQ